MALQMANVSTKQLKNRSKSERYNQNSDLELAGGLLHLEVAAQCFDIRERTIISKTDNLATLYWQCKGSTTSERVPSYLLRLFGIP